MKELTVGVVASVVLASGANAAFVGGGIFIDAALSAQASADLASPTTVTNLYIVFDEADDILNSIGNADFGVRSALAPLVQIGPFGADADTDDDVNPGAFAMFPETEWDSYVGIGGPLLGASNSTTDPDFGWTETRVRGGWFDIPGPGGSRQGVAGDGVDLGAGLWGVWAGRFVVDGRFPQYDGNTIGDGFIGTGLFRGGVLDVNWLDFAGGSNNAVNGVFVGNLEPAPGTAGLFAIAGVFTSRRRR